MTAIKDQINEQVDNLKTQPIQEGHWTKQIENQTAKIPSVFFLNVALGSIAASAIVKLIRRHTTTANFIGLWVPTFLLLGIYNKLVKIEGNDRYNRA